MKIVIKSDFHGAAAEMSLYTSNREHLRLTGKQLRRLLSEICPVDGCDCFRHLVVLIDDQPAGIRWIDPDADDERPGIEIALPPV